MAHDAAAVAPRRVGERGSAAESTFDTQWLDAVLPAARSERRWIGWRLRLLVGAALIGCLGLILFARDLAATRHIDAVWRVDAQGGVELLGSADPVLAALRGRTLFDLAADDADMLRIDDALALQRSARWLVADAERERHRRLHDALATVLAHDSVVLRFTDGSTLPVSPVARGWLGVGTMAVLLGALALTLYLAAMVVLLGRPSLRNALYAAMALAQSANLLFVAAESSFDFGLPAGFAALDLRARSALDLVTAAAILHAAVLHPRRLPHGGALAAACWAGVAALVGLDGAGRLPYAWWWTQGSLLTVAAGVTLLLGWSFRIEPHPHAMMLRRFGFVVTATLALLTLAIAAADARPGLQHAIVSVGSVAWYVFFASLLLLVPFMSQARRTMREFALLAAVSTVAASLDLLFVAAFSVGAFASATLSLFIALGVYAGARQWLLNQVLGHRTVTTERMFERLYRTARDVEAHPEHAPRQLAELLRELFDPLEAVVVERTSSRTRVVAEGSTLLVPVPDLDAPAVAAPAAPRQSVALRYAHRGRRVFTVDDARLTDRVVEQLLRAVAFDKAVEQGRNEERLRLAQDLHDDIGARLLTLMYKAPTPEMEDYVRHTLQDLKTLTRGLAAPARPLTHAAAEWKADLAQRLHAAGAALDWHCRVDDDVALGIVQWSALTRVLRELASNAIAHARATRVTVELQLAGDRLVLRFDDNGVGRNPQAWSHGLGLAGVRKRVKQLGGEVAWRELEPRGIGCRVVVDGLSQRH